MEREEGRGGVGGGTSNVKLDSDTGVNYSAAVSHSGPLSGGGCVARAMHANARRRRGRGKGGGGGGVGSRVAKRVKISFFPGWGKEKGIGGVFEVTPRLAERHLRVGRSPATKLASNLLGPACWAPREHLQ